MKLFTSNYARHGKDPNGVCISIKPIWWFKGRCYFPLAPTWDIVMGVKKGEIDNDEYTVQYRKILDKLNPQKVVNDLGDGAIMLCYESPKDFCHRHLVAAWLNETLNLDVQEIFLMKKETVDLDLLKF